MKLLEDELMVRQDKLHTCDEYKEAIDDDTNIDKNMIRHLS